MDATSRTDDADLDVIDLTDPEFLDTLMKNLAADALERRTSSVA
jgi:hypothetical protein